MIEVKGEALSDGEVRIVEVNSGNPTFDSDLLNELNGVLNESKGWGPEDIPAAIVYQASSIVLYLIEEHFSENLRIIFYKDSGVILQTEHQVRVGLPDQEEVPVERVSRYSRPPVI